MKGTIEKESLETIKKILKKLGENCLYRTRKTIYL